MTMHSKATAVHFAHANGIPAGTYQMLFNALKQQALDTLGHELKLHAIPQLAHNPDFPITDGWSCLCDELIEYIEQHYDDKIIGVGHSLGGVLTYLAAQKRPDLFSQIIMLDPPLAASYLGVLVKLSKWFGFTDHIMPSGKSKSRRRQWDSPQHAFDSMKGKSLWKHWPDESIKDYINSATCKNQAGIELSFLVENECAIFRTIYLFPDFDARLPLPCTVIHADNTNVSHPHLVKSFVKRHKAKSKLVSGTHMFPIEKPESTAREIIELIKQSERA